MKKSKWVILGQDIDRVNNQEYDDWFNYWYDGEYYYDYDYEDEYQWTESVYSNYVSKRGIRVTLDRMLVGGYIDMMAIYPKSILRQMKIDYLLGASKWDVVKKPTLGDIVKFNKYKDEEN